MQSGSGIIDDQLIRKVVKFTPPPISDFLLTSETNTETIIAHYKMEKTLKDFQSNREVCVVEFLS